MAPRTVRWSWLVGRSGVVSLLVLAFALPAHAKTYRAERYDVTIDVRADGAIDVTEIAAFVFDGQGETFSRIYRDLPATRTDGIDLLGVTFEGQPLALDGPAVRVTSRLGGIRVEVHFEPIAQGRRTLSLRYRARQAISRERDAAWLRWTPLPDRRGYTIASSTVEIVWPGLRAAPTSVSTRRDDGVSVVVGRRADAITIASANLRSNRTYQVRLELPSSAVSPDLPRWQQVQMAREARRRERMALGGLAAGLVVLGFVMVWRRHRPDAGGHGRTVAAADGPPSSLSVALASALARHGNTTPADVTATIVDLARQGFLRIEGVADDGKSSNHRLVRLHHGTPAAEHEREALALLFPGERRGPREVSYEGAVAAAQRQPAAFKAAVRRDLLRGGWLDEQRLQVRRAMVRAALFAMVLGGLVLAVVLLAANTPDDREWAWIPGGVALGGVVGLLLGAAVSPLSDRGAAEARRWTTYQRTLAAIAKGRTTAAGLDWGRALPFAVAAGLAGTLAGRAAALGLATPAWFVADRRREGAEAFHGWLAGVGASTTDSGSGDSGSDGGGGGGSGGDGGGGGGSGAD